MKANNKLLFGATITGILLFAACTNTAEDQRERMDNKMENVREDLRDAAEADTRREYESERNNALDKLRSLRNNIDRELSNVNERLAKKDLKADKRQRQTELQAELMQQKEQVARMIEQVESGNQDGWNDLRNTTRQGTQDVENWWDRTKDNFDGDNRTDGDRDMR